MQKCLFALSWVCAVGWFGLNMQAQDTQAQDTASSVTARSVSPVRAEGPVEKLQGDFQFTEGPAWDGEGKLYFTDIPANQILVWQDSGKAAVKIEPSHHANGLLVEAGGRLVACQMDGQVVSYDLATGESQLLAGEYQGKRFNAPNDLIVDSVGGVYFTDPLYRAPEPLPQEVQTVYYIAVDGTVTRVTEHLPAPNGIGLSPDGKRLYVIPSMSAEMLVYEVLGPGKLGEPKVFCRLQQKEAGANSGGDGMAVDTQGNVYITAHDGVQVYDAQGDHLTTLEFPEQPANVTFGGPQRNQLFVTARTGLYRVSVSTQGVEPARLQIGR